ncbi:hypothetical protein L2E82_14869 [Cichorium intybus]|uniref:Uncharacterized protein n=1 Tax=Cichorium intybus TaxID=13427 RepID=A0ACB9F172_CICIN|nr:hypothetical protein L2E82_14869 [Cichorium intybus]
MPVKDETSQIQANYAKVALNKLDKIRGKNINSNQTKVGRKCWLTSAIHRVIFRKIKLLMAPNLERSETKACDEVSMNLAYDLYVSANFEEQMDFGENETKQPEYEEALENFFCSSGVIPDSFVLSSGRWNHLAIEVLSASAEYQFVDTVEMKMNAFHPRLAALLPKVPVKVFDSAFSSSPPDS